MHSNVLHCDRAESVLEAIETSWNGHQARNQGFSLGLYTTLALLLNDEGVVVDTIDGLNLLEHCRRRNLPVVDVLHLLESRIRSAGYRGDRLTLADFAIGGKTVYAFYDASRFRTSWT